MTAIDRPSLDRNTGSDTALILDILGIFRSQMIPEAKRVTTDIGEVERRRLAHRVRGAALGIGALTLAGRAAVLEREAAETADLEAFRAALADLAGEIDHMLAGA